MRRGWALFVLLLVTACGTGETMPVSVRVVSTPEPTGVAKAKVSLPTPTPKATVASSSSSASAPAKAVAPVPAKKLPVPVPVAPAVGLGAYKKLGSWIDVFDHHDSAESIVPLVNKMADLGTKTLYLETARFSSETDIQMPKAVGAALDAAKGRGMKVVAWYPPNFVDVDLDVRRSVAAVKFRSPEQNRFDSFAADIEYTQGVPDDEKRNARTLDYSKRLRNAVGKSYPLAAIVIPPSSLEINPTRWPNFPWKQLAADYDIFMPMNYWTARSKDAKTARELTSYNVSQTKKLTGRPVHIIGGLGEHADGAQTEAYVKACLESGSLGGGLYDFRTTRSDVWDELRKLN
ncbi:MAG: hypothetical protein WD826_02605 [Actinomycetota bacterium]